MVNWKEIDQNVREWIKEAGNRIRETFASTVHISTKSNRNDLVTNVDRETEQFFAERIRKYYPDHKILGEEGFGDQIDSVDGVVWVIDPIDGTMNFIHQKRNFMISIGIYYNGEGYLGYIYDVVHKELYFAEKGHGAYLNDQKLLPLEETVLQDAVIGLNPTWVVENKKIDHNLLIPIVKEARGLRTYGCAALEMVYVACGWLDAYITTRLSPWDFAGGKVIVEEVGGKVTTLSGKPLSILENSSVFASKPGLHKQILETYLKDYKD